MNLPLLNSATPILDLTAPLPKSSRRDRLSPGQALLIVGVPFLGIVLVVFAVVTINNPFLTNMFNYVGRKLDTFFGEFGSQGPLLFCAVYFSTMFLALTIHELGHLGAGWAFGFSFASMRIGPVTIAKGPRGLKLSAQRLSDIDGIAEIRIASLRRLRRRLAGFIAGGPLANLLSGMFVLALLLVQISQGLDPAVRHSLQFLGAFSIFLAVINLIPWLRPNGMLTDGGRLLSLANSKTKTQRWLALIALKLQIESGSRLRDLKRTWIAHSCALSDRSLDALPGFWFSYLAANDRKEVQKAGQNLERCLELFGIASRAFQTTLLMEAAVYHAWFHDDAEKAETWSARCETNAPAPPLQQIRKTICMAWVRRRYDQGLLAWEKGRAWIERFPASPHSNLLRTAWQEWKTELEEKRSEHEAMG